ncbi:MBL fold metallo-hydrolase [Marinihelvus fidelis]|uniref:MBL fold metallo-hydrolase n=2 Tax=Marinihelvus fidelis TaxID=2613842 RepID=A0A5N0TGK2_9GAMM|nr:MBL fold metallo-hydrolase [Marinihelvus fidelis]
MQFTRGLLALVILIAPALAPAEECEVELFVLGAGQDAGAPHIGYPDDPAWADPALGQTATSIAVVDHVAGERFLFEATPHVTRQLQLLDTLAPADGPGLGLDGVFLTHAHIGHYAGLMYFGREGAGADGIPVFVMPRFAAFLQGNGPWSQLVKLENIVIQPLAAETPVQASKGIHVTPLTVPHRDEFSETVGFVIVTNASKTLFLPDLDSWDEWAQASGIDLATRVVELDHLFVDATFFQDGELTGRDMSEIPHPRVKDTMERLSGLSPELRQKVRFIHYNHTNPIRFPASPESALVSARGFDVARAGDRLCLAP